MKELCIAGAASWPDPGEMRRVGDVIRECVRSTSSLYQKLVAYTAGSGT
jgi:hypothetical protein